MAAPTANPSDSDQDDTPCELPLPPKIRTTNRYIGVLPFVVLEDPTLPPRTRVRILLGRERVGDNAGQYTDVGVHMNTDDTRFPKDVAAYSAFDCFMGTLGNLTEMRASLKSANRFATPWGFAYLMSMPQSALEFPRVYKNMMRFFSRVFIRDKTEEGGADLTSTGVSLLDCPPRMLRKDKYQWVSLQSVAPYGEIVDKPRDLKGGVLSPHVQDLLRCATVFLNEQ